MSLLAILIYIAHGTGLREFYSKRCPDEIILLELFSRILTGKDECSFDQLSSALKAGLTLPWKDVYDKVNPFGDRRGDIFKGVWIFDLDQDLLLLRRKDQLSSTPLSLARQRLLTPDDFEALPSPPPAIPKGQPLPGPYWEPELIPQPRLRSFLGRILCDFAYTWRHVLRGQMNTTTFLRLACAITWLSDLNFAILERTGFEHISGGGPYVWVVDLPDWEAPKQTIVRAGLCWFALAQDPQEGLEMVQDHMKKRGFHDNSTYGVAIYVILTLKEVVLCKCDKGELVWTQSEMLFDGNGLSSRGTDMILWAVHGVCTQPEVSAINPLPIEIQDRILYHASTSVVAAAKLGCELGLGSSCTWIDDGVKMRVEERKRHRFENSPIESQIVLYGVMSGLSYKRERPCQPAHYNRRPIRAEGHPFICTLGSHRVLRRPIT